MCRMRHVYRESLLRIPAWRRRRSDIAAAAACHARRLAWHRPLLSRLSSVELRDTAPFCVCLPALCPGRSLAPGSRPGCPRPHAASCSPSSSPTSATPPRKVAALLSANRAGSARRVAARPSPPLTVCSRGRQRCALCYFRNWQQVVPCWQQAVPCWQQAVPCWHDDALRSSLLARGALLPAVVRGRALLRLLVA
jgi:hypothetical protein